MALRRRRQGLPDSWRDVLELRSAQWRLLDDDERERLGDLADWLLRTKRWEAARGFELTDDARTLLAAHAALPILALDESWYEGVGAIVVREGSMSHNGSSGPIRGTIDRDVHTVDGETHHGDGPIMVSWRAARREAANPRFARDVVIHEFAHKIDMRDGVIDGTPILADEDERDRWIAVCTEHYEAVRAGDPGLRDYAGTNPGEFFAVVTEAFFTRPIDLCERKPDLYDAFADFYNQDPAARMRAFVEQSEAPAALTVLARPRIVCRRRA